MFNQILAHKHMHATQVAGHFWGHLVLNIVLLSHKISLSSVFRRNTIYLIITNHDTIKAII